jgi:hypothetical protein
MKTTTKTKTTKTKQPAVHELRQDRAMTYPAAPADPAQRLEWMRRRNAAISGVDPDEYLDAIAQQEQRHGLGVEQREIKR